MRFFGVGLGCARPGQIHNPRDLLSEEFAFPPHVQQFADVQMVHEGTSNVRMSKFLRQIASAHKCISDVWSQARYMPQGRLEPRNDGCSSEVPRRVKRVIRLEG